MDCPNTLSLQTNSQHYRVEVRGHLDLNWSDWFDNVIMTHQASGNTVMTGYFVDQAALFGLLNKVRDLGLILVSVNPVNSKNREEI